MVEKKESFDEKCGRVAPLGHRRATMDESGCEYIKCRFASRDDNEIPICLDEREFVNADGEAVCGMRDDAIRKEDSDG